MLSGDKMDVAIEFWVKKYKYIFIIKTSQELFWEVVSWHIIYNVRTHTSPDLRHFKTRLSWSLNMLMSSIHQGWTNTTLSLWWRETVFGVHWGGCQLWQESGVMCNGTLKMWSSHPKKQTVVRRSITLCAMHAAWCMEPNSWPWHQVRCELIWPACGWKLLEWCQRV